MSSKFPRPKPGEHNGNARSVLNIKEVTPTDPRRQSDGQWNFYRCSTCGGFFVTVDVAEGATAASLQCRAPQATGRPCPGRMMSAFYPKPENWPEQVPRRADAEWYVPSGQEKKVMRKKFPALYGHVMAGGLVMRVAHKRTPSFPEVGA